MLLMDLFENNSKATFPKIICVGMNYLQHVKEIGEGEVPSTPVIFLKPWSTVNYKPKTLSLPSSSFHRVDHELELGVYIENGGKNISKEEAMSHVGGYFIGIDFSDRDFQNESKTKGIPWALAKCQDNFCPISQLFGKEHDPYQVQLELRVNKQIRQRDLTGKMHFKIDEIISFVSKYITLSKGDLILTGTPSGVGPVKKGDHIQAFARTGEKNLAELSFYIEE